MLLAAYFDIVIMGFLGDSDSGGEAKQVAMVLGGGECESKRAHILQLVRTCKQLCVSNPVWNFGFG